MGDWGFGGFWQYSPLGRRTGARVRGGQGLRLENLPARLFHPMVLGLGFRGLGIKVLGSRGVGDLGFRGLEVK